MRIREETLERWMQEDVPYLDLTTLLLDVGDKPGRLAYFSREQTVVCGSEEVRRIFTKLNITIGKLRPSGSRIEGGELILEGFGPASALHEAWKVCLNVLEYASGIATRTRALVDVVQAVDPKVNIVTTRKSFPGTKELSIKAAISGGALPHRLGLSETILIFDQHKKFLDHDLGTLIPSLKRVACEKKVVVEAATCVEAEKLCAAGVDGIQFDKLDAQELAVAVARLRKMRPELLIIAAGGITASNAAPYASAGVDAIATSWAYFGKPSDIRAVMESREGESDEAQ